MSRGKYSARTANREATLDNDIIREKTNLIEAHVARIRELEATLAAERKDRGAEVIRRATSWLPLR